MEKTPSSANHSLDINSISTLRGIDSYDATSNTGVWYLPDMPDHAITKSGDEDARFVTLSGRDTEVHEYEQLQQYLRRLGETAVTGSNLVIHTISE